MKKNLLALLLCLAALPAFSQLYIRANVGYNLPLSGESMGSEYKYDYQNNDNGRYKGVYGSYGTGLSADLAFGGMFGNGLFGYDLGFSYLVGKEYSVEKNESIDPYGTSLRETTRQARSIQFSPALTFIGGTGKFQPVARFGPVFSQTKIDEEYNDSYANSYTFLEKSEYSGGLGIGLRGSVGVTYGLSESVKLFTELNFLAMSYAPKEREITTYEVNGENRIEDIPKEDRTIELDEEGESQGEGGEPPLKRPFAMNSWGLQVGVLFFLKK
ncbi:hypothetical protein [Pseudochryseolinea flava]|uniref:Outer membrane protein beta-barrel domain-containing protein n=1 Tax=Pseudochryseolinea flava TaxID=2059302 RepID=A0A364Y2Z5_9BACT|nr:hypothetical protein [Pseudochryseolinea flava]RAW00506.1 hypothetical protein DQQ10_12970 [Pseudochryseolinea flava]